MEEAPLKDDEKGGEEEEADEFSDIELTEEEQEALAELENETEAQRQERVSQFLEFVDEILAREPGLQPFKDEIGKLMDKERR